MLSKIRKFGLPLLFVTFIWLSALITGGEYFHHEAHHHSDEEEGQECSWSYILVTSFIGVSAALLVVRLIRWFQVTPSISTFPFIPIYRIFSSRAPPAFILK